jgi:hypothetical protein
MLLSSRIVKASKVFCSQSNHGHHPDLSNGFYHVEQFGKLGHGLMRNP